MEGGEGEAYFERNLETWRQLWRVVERSDVVVLVADVRFVGMHFVPDLWEWVKGEGKGMVLALNKCDLVSEELLVAWKGYFEREFEGLSVALFSSFPDAKLAPSKDNSELLSRRERRMARSRLAAWGADQLLRAIDSTCLAPHKKEYLGQWRALLGEHDDPPALAHGACDDVLSAEDGEPSDDDDGTSFTEDASHAESDAFDDDAPDTTHEGMVTVGVVGHPNAGKSSLINGVFGRKVVSTSATPGHTKHLQTMFLSSHVRLCDCPGLVFPGRVSRELQVLAGMFPIAQLREPYGVVKYLAERVPLVSILDLDTEVPALEKENGEPFPGRGGWTAWTICEAWAFKRGFRTAKAARLDTFRAANSILRLALDGRIVLATSPPGWEPVREDRDASVMQATYERKQDPLPELHTSDVDRESEDTSGESAEESDESADEGVSTMGMFALLEEDEE